MRCLPSESEAHGKGERSANRTQAHARPLQGVCRGVAEAQANSQVMFGTSRLPRCVELLLITHWGTPAAELTFLPQGLCLSSLQMSFRFQKPSQLTSHWDKDPIICFQTVIYFVPVPPALMLGDPGRPSCSLLLPPVFFCWYYTDKKKHSYDKRIWMASGANKQPREQKCYFSIKPKEHWTHSPRVEESSLLEIYFHMKRGF